MGSELSVTARTWGLTLARCGAMFNFVPRLGFNVQPEALPGFQVRDPTAASTDINRMAGGADSSNATAYIFNPYTFSLGVATPRFAPPSPVSTDDDYCREVVANCRRQCAARYEVLGGSLGFPRMRKCIRDGAKWL
jgi:hypothetical protein